MRERHAPVIYTPARVEGWARRPAASYAGFVFSSDFQRCAIRSLPTFWHRVGRLVEARSIFTAVRDAAPECDSALSNLAQIHAVQREPQAAIVLYEKAQRRDIGAPSASLLALQARAHFDAGSLIDARRVLSRALYQRPNHLGTRYNLAAVLYRSAKPPRNGPPRSLAAINTAASNVAIAIAKLDVIRDLLDVQEADWDGAGAGGVTAARVASLRGRCLTLQTDIEEEQKEAELRTIAQVEAQRIADER